ncbi:DUF6924 domain-containing protein [Nocardiopsis sp. CNT312]|uniref:DUF6924 domain-containing protein n=1 Tax=Nocardiopsis sp. CNT312 TaxID=1137268 RepID=UPI0012DFC8D3|nr:hypothetical protein [Nocardiopsis sp. CNT312]
MRRPPLPPPFPGTSEEALPGLLVVRTAFDDQDAWRNTLAHLIDLPGVYPSPQGGDDGIAHTREDRILFLVDDPAWRDATIAEIASAWEQAGPWRPELVLLADGRTMDDPVHRPLLAFMPFPEGNESREEPFLPCESVMRIGTRQAAMLYLVLSSGTVVLGADRAAPPREPDQVFGAELDLLSAPPRYRPCTGRPSRLPVSENPLVVRTHHGDDEVWNTVIEAVRFPVFDEGAEPPEDDPDAPQAYVDTVDDTSHSGLTFEQLMALTPCESHSFLMVADELTMRDPRHPLLVVDLCEQPGKSFRAAPGAIQAIENNLSAANMDFYEFDCGEGFIQYWDVEHEPGRDVL